MVGAGWLMTTIAESREMVALVQASATLPVMLFSIAAGALADNLDRRRIMILAQLFMLTVSVLLALTTFLGLITPWLLLLFTFLIGCGMALHNPSWHASLGDIVERKSMRSAVVLNSVGFNLMRGVGPAVGGFLVAVAGAFAAFALNAVSYVFLIFALWRWRPPRRASGLPRERTGRAIATGLGYLAMSPPLLITVFRAFLFGIGAIALQALLPLIARELLGGEAAQYGILLGCFGFGAVAGAVINGWIAGRFRNEIVVRTCSIVFALSTLLVSLSGNIVLSCLLMLVSGACWLTCMTMFNYIVQMSAPRWVVGRALAVHQTAVFGGMTVGGWIWGMAAEANGLEIALVLAACWLAAAALVGLLLALPEASGDDLDPLNQFSAPALGLELDSRSGPVIVLVEYEIAQSDVPAFLAAMARRRRVRLRDGARQWSLLRDVEQPTRWTESYHVASWTEYIRHQERRTQADAGLNEALRALHRGPGRPVVRRMIERHTVPRSDDTPLREIP